MATKKEAPKKTGTELQPWEKELTDLAKEGAESAASGGGASKKIGTRGGRFSIDGAEVEGNVLQAVILDWLFDVTYYADDFDPDDITPPTASALGRDEKTLVWAEGSHPDFAGKELKDSEVFQWGSADKGRGKAAKSRRRMLLISGDDLEEDIGAADVRRLMVPVTSGTEWDAYVKAVKSSHNRPSCGVLTEITISSHPKYQFTLSFKMLGLVEDEFMAEVLEKRRGVQEELLAPYSNYDEVQEEKAPRGGGKAVAKTATPKGGKPASKARR